MKMILVLFATAALLGAASGQITAAQNFAPATITVNTAPFQVIATPITPNAPYPQNAFQCNVSGDSRIPGGATYPLTVKVPSGQMVRVIFANGNLGNGATVTQQGEPGVIVQQGASPIVQQSGGASPIVQGAGSPIVQQSTSPAALVVQQGPTTVVQQPSYQVAPTVPAYGYGSGPPSVPRPPVYGGRKLRQDTVPGGPNNGQVEYVALSSSNTVPGFVVPNTQFGVPYVEFTASSSSAGQTATFSGALEVAVVVGGVPQVPFTPNPNRSPGCQVTVNFQNA